MKNRKPLLCTIIILLAVDLYALSFFVFSKPCPNLNRAPDYLVNITSENLIYPSITVLCISENPTVNAFFFYFYYPIHKSLEVRNFTYFPKAPDKLE